MHIFNSSHLFFFIHSLIWNQLIIHSNSINQKGVDKALIKELLFNQEITNALWSVLSLTFYKSQTFFIKNSLTPIPGHFLKFQLTQPNSYIQISLPPKEQLKMTSKQILNNQSDYTGKIVLQKFRPFLPHSHEKAKVISNEILSNIISHNQNKLPLFNIVKTVKPEKFIPKQTLASQKDTNQLNFAQIVRNVLKSNYQKLISEYQGTNRKFTDSDFPPNGSSIGGRWSNHHKWKRVCQIMPNPVFVNNKIEPNDILQGEIGNCYFLSALASLAQKDYRIKNIFPSLEIQKNGIYMARILHRGILQQVVVDDFIPVNQKNEPLFAKASGGNEIWVIILQKCWAKLHKNYAAISGGLPHQVLHAFSGAPTFYNSMPRSKDAQDALFEVILDADRKGALLCCGTISDLEIEKKGLVIGHAYTLLAVFDSPYRMVKIRNPWGEKEWNGRASEFDLEFWSQISKEDTIKLGHQSKNDGTFFMLWQDFTQVFNMVDVCQIQDTASYLSVSSKFVQEQGIMFELNIHTPGKVVVAVTQDNIRTFTTDLDKKRGYAKTTIIFSKYNSAKKGYEYSFYKASQYEMLPDHYMTFDHIEPGKYMVFVECDWFQGKGKEATVSVYTASKIQLIQRQDIDCQSFLYQVFMDHARRNLKKRQLLGPEGTEWKCEQFLLGKCNYGYAAYHLAENSRAKLGIELIENEYEKRNMRLLKPYGGYGKIKTAVSAGQQLIILFKMDPYRTAVSFTIPLPKVYKLVL